MIYQFSVPQAVPDVEEVRILEWHGQPGDEIKSGELVVELETHKAVFEVRTSRDVVLREIFSKAGDWQRLGIPLALFSDDVSEPLPARGSVEIPELPTDYALT